MILFTSVNESLANVVKHMGSKWGDPAESLDGPWT